MKNGSNTLTKKYKQYQVVEIEWIDSLHDSGWKYKNDVEYMFGDIDRLTHYTLGYFLKETELSLVVCQSVQKKNDWNDGDRSTDARMEIPKGAIKSIKVWKK